MKWMDYAANLVIAGNDTKASREALDDMLRSKVSVGSAAKGCDRAKLINNLSKIWINPPKDIVSFRDDGLEILRECEKEMRLAVHWGMITAAYPFWLAVASQTGRLLGLQKKASSAQVKRRLHEQYGERATVTKAAAGTMKTFTDWGVLKETGKRGMYEAGSILKVADPVIIAWLIEASVHAQQRKSSDLRTLIGSPSLFPFKTEHIYSELIMNASSRLEIQRHGLDEDLVTLKRKAKAKKKEPEHKQQTLFSEET